MGAEEALQLIDGLVFIATGKYLTDNQREVFQRSFQGETYPAMAKVMHLEPETVKDIGFELWNLLSEVLGEKVTKKNFRAALDRARTLHQQSCSSPSPAFQKVGTIQGETGFAEMADDLGFVGRGGAIADLNSLVNQGAKMILIHAAGGIGKSKLAYRYLKTQGFDVVLELWMAKETQNITSAESVVEEWLRRYLDEEPGREFGVSLERLRQKLREPSQRIGVLIDNLEPALDKDGKFIETQRSYVELLRVLADPDAKAITLITSRERLRESAITPRVYSLEGLDEGAWRQYFEGYGIQIDAPSLNAMHHTYAGNAKAMEILAGAVKTDFEGNLIEYWQVNSEDFRVERDLEDLVVSQINRLQKLDSDAYNLLCRLGCYRYQDVPTVSIEGLVCMLWDIPTKQHKRVIKALQDRSLINCKNDEFWLHPVIRAEAVDRLREDIEAWHTANSKAAEFWSILIKDVTNLDEGIMKLESFYHYQSIENYDSAASVLTYDHKYESLIQTYSLIGKLRGFGVYSKCIQALESLVVHIGDLSEFNKQDVFGFLGDFYSILGYSKKAIKSYQEAIKLNSGNNSLRYCDFLAALALLYLYIGEYQESVALFERVLTFAEELTQHKEDCILNSLPVKGLPGQRILASTYSCLSYAYKALGNLEKASQNLKLALEVKNWIRSQNGSWWEIYGNYNLARASCLNGYFRQGREACVFLHRFSRKFRYPLSKGLAFSAAAEIALEQDQLNKALSRMEKAKQILERIGAKNDLAEVYLKLALVYKKQERIRDRQESLLKAIQLFDAINAPSQVERARLALQELKFQET